MRKVLSFLAALVCVGSLFSVCSLARPDVGELTEVKSVECPTCHGSKRNDLGHTCGRCEGEGKCFYEELYFLPREYDFVAAPPYTSFVHRPCPLCEKPGMSKENMRRDGWEVRNFKCDVCDGSGIYTVELLSFMPAKICGCGPDCLCGPGCTCDSAR
jgi:hypothetical protein